MEFLIYLRGNNQIAYDIKLLYGGHHILFEYPVQHMVSGLYYHPSTDA